MALNRYRAFYTHTSPEGSQTTDGYFDAKDHGEAILSVMAATLALVDGGDCTIRKTREFGNIVFRAKNEARKIEVRSSLVSVDEVVV